MTIIIRINKYCHTKYDKRKLGGAGQTLFSLCFVYLFLLGFYVTDRQTDRQTETNFTYTFARVFYDMIDIFCLFIFIGFLCYRQTDRQADRQTDRQTDRDRLYLYIC